MIDEWIEALDAGEVDADALRDRLHAAREALGGGGRS